MTPREIALAMFATIGVPEPAHDDLKGITESVLCSLRNNEGETVRAIEGPRPVRWKFAASHSSHASEKEVRVGMACELGSG
jgi:hypothetical protein